jgi:hypothetical protein
MVGAPDPRFHPERTERQAPLLVGNAPEVGSHRAAPGVEICEPVLRQLPRFTLRRCLSALRFQLTLLRGKRCHVRLDEGRHVGVVRVGQSVDEVTLFAGDLRRSPVDGGDIGCHRI